MRTLPTPIADALASRLYIGDKRVSGRVTVEADWFNTPETAGLGLWPANKTPIRWWQRADNGQLEVEVPGIIQITRDKSVDNAAPTCEIVIANQKLNPNAGAGRIPDELGNPGWLWPLRGWSSESQARWGHAANEWRDVLLQNALIRVYQGFGGLDLSVPDAFDQGHLILRFVGLIDVPSAATDGKFTIKCRGMTGGLLVDQDLYPPLVPLEQYPLVYQRWVFNNVALNAGGRDVGEQINTTPADRPVTLSNSSSDMWYPQGSPGSQIPSGGYPLNGHPGSHALDGNDDSYWLGEGNARPDAPFAVNFLEVDCGGQTINAIYVHPWAGDYTMYISVLEHGIWQGTDVVPYDHSEIEGQAYWVDTGANIPFVQQEGVPWETAKEYILPRAYAADRVRITFRDLANSGIGPYVFRAGVREFRCRVSASGSSSLTDIVHLDPLWLAAAPHPTSGFWTTDTWGQVDAFGAARVLGPSVASNPNNRIATAIRSTPSGNGFYVLYGDGALSAFGDAQWLGDLVSVGEIPHSDTAGGPAADLAIDIAVTADGGGYWILYQKGKVRAFGNASNLVSFVAPTGLPGHCAMESMPTHPDGLLIADAAGKVHAYGSAVHHGDVSPLFPPVPNAVAWSEMCMSLRRTVHGDGYWILTNSGRVFAFGAAPNLGGLTPERPKDGSWGAACWDLLPNPIDDTGYLVFTGSGETFPIGVVDYYAGPAAGTSQQRSDGNYLDLTDIVRDVLLWSGYFLKENVAANAQPTVFGTLETTGTYVNGPLNSDRFDKKHPIDVINMIKEIVGYIIGERDDGGFIFTSPNWWQSGNFDEDQQHTDFIPEIDERVDLTNYGAQLPAQPLRDRIIVSSAEVDPNNPSMTKHVEYIPPWAGLMHGMVRPLLWSNGGFTDQAQMEIMAELISLHIWFQLRVSQVDAWINPAIEPNDQVRVFERQLSDTFIHYVRGINDTMVLQGSRGSAGSWTMKLTTNWLGDAENWAITNEDVDQSNDLGMPSKFPLSSSLREWLRQSGSIRAFPGFRTLQPAADGPTYMTTAVAPGGTGAGPG